MSVGTDLAVARAAFDEAFRVGYQNTSRFLMTRGANADVAAEVAQAAWARGWECRDQLIKADAIGAWVNSIALNILRNSHRHDGRMRGLTDTILPTSLSLAALDISPVLRHCPRKDVDLLKDFYLNGYSTGEIACRTGICATTIRVRLLRSRRHLRSRLLRKAA